MEVLYTLACSLLLATLAVCAIYFISKTKSAGEYSIPLYGALVFMYISWITVYTANLHPFTSPVIPKRIENNKN